MDHNIVKVANNMELHHNVTIRVIDANTRQVVASHEGHNAATNSMLLGIAHYLQGDGVLNQGISMLNRYIPKYISLGTMGINSQASDEFGLPLGVGELSDKAAYEKYVSQRPGYGADGYDANDNNERKYLGLGPKYADRIDVSATNCELISDTFPRAQISYREIVPESQAELENTIDVVYSALISTGALAQFRDKGSDHIFITEAGLWATPNWVDAGDNGLLAGYRLLPPNEANWDMSLESNRQIVRKNILRVGINQVVQVIWKIQIGGVNELGKLEKILKLYWNPIA